MPTYNNDDYNLNIPIDPTSSRYEYHGVLIH